MGVQGPQGEAGPTGSPGSAGAPGSTGPQGAPGTEGRHRTAGPSGAVVSAWDASGARLGALVTLQVAGGSSYPVYRSRFARPYFAKYGAGAGIASPSWRGSLAPDLTPLFRSKRTACP